MKKVQLVLFVKSQMSGCFFRNVFFLLITIFIFIEKDNECYFVNALSVCIESDVEINLVYYCPYDFSLTATN
jgi:hypothetical protein